MIGNKRARGIKRSRLSTPLCPWSLIVAINKKTRKFKRRIVIHTYFVLYCYVVVFIVGVYYFYSNISQPRKETVFPKRRGVDLAFRSRICGFIRGLLHGVTVFHLRRNKFKQKLIGSVVRDIEIFGNYSAVRVGVLLFIYFYVSALVHVTVILSKRRTAINLHASVS